MIDEFGLIENVLKKILLLRDDKINEEEIIMGNEEIIITKLENRLIVQVCCHEMQFQSIFTCQLFEQQRYFILG